jgi:uncharacterized protein
MTVTLSRKQAAQVAIRAQMLDCSSRRTATPEDLRTLIQRLALIQIDTIHVVARSQYVIPWSRFGEYDPAWLDELHYPGRELFEYWGHAASLIDSKLLWCFLSRMDERRGYDSPDHTEWIANNEDLIEHVRQTLRDSGPLTTLSFERPNPDQPVEPWAWHGGKPTSHVLDHLWRIGDAGIHRRLSFRREYDLIERVHPEIIELDRPDPWDERTTLADRALQAMGICRPEWLNDYFRTRWGTRNNHAPGPQELLDHLVQQERALPVQIEGLGPAYVTVDQEQALRDVQSGYTATRTTLLSPFDNLIWDRQRTLELFDFEYRIECYTPAAKRQYGYFTLPILHRGRLVGRVDPKVDRKNRRFYVHSLHLEPKVSLSKRLINDLRGTLHAFARWNGADEIVSGSGPSDLMSAIEGRINS